MTSRRELVEAALLRRDTDRIPCFPLIDVVYASTQSGRAMARLQLDPEEHAAALGRCVRELPVDGVYVNLCLSAEQAARAVCRDGCYQVPIDDCLEVRFTENDVAAISRTDTHSLEDDRIDRAELFHPGMLATLQAMPADARQEAAICVGLTGTFSQLGFLVGLQKLMLAMVDSPRNVHQALARRQTVALRQVEDLCRAGARVLWIGEGMASGSLISPAMYREFVLPYEQELADRIRELGGLSLLHICGNTTAMLAEIATSRCDGYDVDFPTDWPKAVEIVGPSVSLKGNISPLLFLRENVDRLAAACEATRRVAGGLKGFIMSTGCLVPRDSVQEAFWRMAEACS